MTCAVLRRSTSRLAIRCALLALFCAAPVSAATHDFYSKKINEFQNVIDGWDRDADIQLGLTIAVITIGAVVIALQNFGKPWVKPATITLGICTTVFTAISAKVISADYRTFEQAAIEGHDLLDQLEQAGDILNSPNAPNDVRTAWDRTVNQFRGLQERVLQGTGPSSPATAWVPALVRIVHAESSLSPDWITKPPQDSLNYYFSGSGRGNSITSAESGALQAAIDSAYDALKPAMVPRSSFASYLTKVAAVDKRWFALNKQDGTYDYALMLRIGKDVNDSLKDLRKVASQFQKSGWHPVDLATNDNGQIFVMDGDGAISQISQSDAQLSLQVLFRIPLAFQVASVTANGAVVLASANSAVGCVVFRYDLSTRVTSQQYLGLHGLCTGIAMLGEDFYIVLAQAKQIALVKSGSISSSEFTEWPSLGMPGTLLVDKERNRLLVADHAGEVFAIDLSNKKATKFASSVGWVNELTTTRNYVFAASGDKILTLLRSTGEGRSSPDALKVLTGGSISGIASHDGELWFIDSTKGILKGPIPVD